MKIGPVKPPSCVLLKYISACILASEVCGREATERGERNVKTSCWLSGSDVGNDS